MREFNLDILAELKRLSTPYVDINNISTDYDIRSDFFVAAYLQLESEGMIASANTSDCGLEVSADGLPSWSVVDVYVTEKGDLALNPPEIEKPSLVSTITNNATFARVVGGIIFLVIVALLVQPRLDSGKKSPPVESSTLNKSSNADGDKATAGS